MAVITTKKLGATVGAEVTDVDKERLLHDDDLPAACLEALEENGALVFRDLHLDDATQVAFVDLAMAIYSAVVTGQVYGGTDLAALRDIAAKLDLEDAE